MNRLWWKLLWPYKGEKSQISDKETEQPQNPLFHELDENINTIRSIYTDCYDLILRTFYISGRVRAVLIYIDGMSNIEELDENVLSVLMQESTAEFNDINIFMDMKLSVSDVNEVTTFSDCVHQISSGKPVILINGSNIGFSLGLAKWEKRSIEESKSESVVRGPREAFIETLNVNTSMLRRKIRSPELKMRTIEIGQFTRTNVVVAYMEGIAEKNLIEEVQTRLARIKIDGILESGMVEEMIEDHPYSPFPQVLSTERPDVAASSLLEGRVVILVDGTPFVIIAPTTFFSLLQSNEDYYSRFFIGTVIRWLRYLFLLASLLLPSLYVAVLTFHQEMVPTKLLLNMAASREHIPFPALVEALIMEITFEALREAGIRMPKQVGSAVSIVGALVIGDAAVSAGIVSAPMVLIIALTGIASFTTPRYSAAITIRMLRFPLMLLSGTLGMLGIMLGIIIIIIHLCTIRSFGVPYLSPLAPMKVREMKDVLIRAPWWKLNTRPHFTGAYNKYRQALRQKPDPSGGDAK